MSRGRVPSGRDGGRVPSGRVRVWGADGTESAWSAPLEIEAGLLEAGDWSATWITAPDPDDPRPQHLRRSFDVTRPVNPAHLAFGFGEHLCLGAALVRLEAQVFFEELLTRYPNYEVGGPAERVPSTLVAGIHSLPVSLVP